MKKTKPELEKIEQQDKTEESSVKPTFTKLFIGIGLGVLVLVVILVMTYTFWPKTTKAPSNESTQATSDTETSQTANSPTSTPKLIIGSPDAKVTIVEYADFKCPLCGRFYRETEPQIKKDYIDSGKVKIEYRPLPIIAKDSTVAALGAYCSAEQSKFEQYHNAVFSYIYTNYYSKSLRDEGSNIFTLETLTKIATEQGLDAQAFTTCMTSNKYSSAIEASENQAKSDGANATPTIIIGTQKISGAQPFAIYKPFIEAQLR